MSKWRTQQLFALSSVHGPKPPCLICIANNTVPTVSCPCLLSLILASSIVCFVHFFPSHDQSRLFSLYPLCMPPYASYGWLQLLLPVSCCSLAMFCEKTFCSWRICGVNWQFVCESCSEYSTHWNRFKLKQKIKNFLRNANPIAPHTIITTFFPPLSRNPYQYTIRMISHRSYAEPTLSLAS